MIEWIDAGNETTVENCVALVDVLQRFPSDRGHERRRRHPPQPEGRGIPPAPRIRTVLSRDGAEYVEVKTTAAGPDEAYVSDKIDEVNEKVSNTNTDATPDNAVLEIRVRDDSRGPEKLEISSKRLFRLNGLRGPV